MAPEVLGSKGHGLMVDWWALGTVVYEMLHGEPPFYQENQKRMFNNIQKKSVKFPKDRKLSAECKHFIESLLAKDPSKRLGSKADFDEVKAHPFFANIDFHALMRKEVPSPYQPFLSKDPFDLSNFDEELISEPLLDESQDPNNVL